MAVRCGIDLGTTYSSISYFDTFEGRVETIDLNSADGRNIIRSVVYYPEGGQPVVVGETAWNAARVYRDRVIAWIKRSMGTAYKTNPIDGKEYTPQEVSAEILRTLAKDAKDIVGEEVKDVVITVPAYFGDNERSATEEAGRLAGLNVIGLLPEPHAAALAFSVEKAADIQDKYLLVYDLGGGTFDVTLIHAKATPNPNVPINLDIQTLCKDGNMSLGGLDWDKALAEIVAEKVAQTHGVDVRADPKNDATLLDNCERAKRDLSRTSSVVILADLASHEAEVTLSEFEDRTSDLLLQTQMLLEKVIEDAEKNHNVKKDQIDVMLSGGATKMPMVAKMIKGVMGKEPLRYKNPELLVTIGAAYWAHLCQAGAPTIPTRVIDDAGNVTRADVTVSTGGLKDVSVYAVGVEVLRPDAAGGWTKVSSVVVPSGAAYEEHFEKEFETSEDAMTEIPIILHKGESENLDECERLATFTITGLPPDLPKGTKVNVGLEYDNSGILRGTATVVKTGKTVDIVYDRTKSAP